jgi:hypothetical protein
MGYTFDWKLTALRKQQSANVEDAVVGTQWKLTATDEDGFSGEFTGATPFDLNAINTGSFVPYSELTETMVLGWVKNLVSGSSAYNYMPHIMQQIQKEIDKKKWSRIDVNETDLPWSPTSGSGVTPDGAAVPTAEMP